MLLFLVSRRVASHRSCLTIPLGLSGLGRKGPGGGRVESRWGYNVLHRAEQTMWKGNWLVTKTKTTQGFRTGKQGEDQTRKEQQTENSEAEKTKRETKRDGGRDEERHYCEKHREKRKCIF